MKFYFCETCGKRITETDIQSGQGRDKKLKGVYCQACAQGVMTMESLPLSNEEARKLLGASGTPQAGAKGLAASHVQVAQTARAATGRVAPIAGRAVQHSVTARRRTSSGPALALAAGAALVCLVLAWLLLHGGASKPKPDPGAPARATVPLPQVAAATGPATKSARPLEPQATPPPEAKKEEGASSAPKEPEAKEAPAKPLDEAAGTVALPTPSEVKPPPESVPEAPATPPVAAPTAAPLPAPDAAGWRPLFNGKDLTGWTHAKSGVLATERGYIERVPGASARLMHDLPGTSIRIAAQVYLAKGVNLDVKTPSGGLELWGGMNGFPVESWTEILIDVRGTEATAMIGGKPAPVALKPKTPLKPTELVVYFKNGNLPARIRDLKVRDLP